MLSSNIPETKCFEKLSESFLFQIHPPNAMHTYHKPQDENKTKKIVRSINITKKYWLKSYYLIKHRTKFSPELPGS
jgi:hypothetical protein